MKIRDIFSLHAVSAELPATDTAAAVNVARALVAGGIRVLEIGMQRNGAPAALEAVRRSVPEAVVGAGGLTRPVDFAAAGKAGAQFGSSPGFTPELAAAARGARFPWLPSVMTLSELLAARAAGFDVVKLFPADGTASSVFLPAMADACSDVAMCPAGIDDGGRVVELLRTPNVLHVTGHWLCPGRLVQAQDWAAIEGLARAGAELRSLIG